MNPRTILVVEDGAEYIETFRRLAPPNAAIDWLAASDAAAAKRLLRERRVDAVFLDVVFDRTPPEALAGDLDALVARFSGDRTRALEYLAVHQGFYVLSELASDLPAGAPVLLAYDFAAEPARLAALRETLPGLEGVEEGTSATRLLGRLLGGPIVA